MAKKKDSKMIWVLLLGGAGVAAYLLYKNSLQGAASPALPAGAAPGSVTTNQVSSGAQSTALVSPSLSPDVTAWASKSLTPANYAQFLQSQSSFTADEINALNDIVINEFEGGRQPTPAETAAWDAWRTKYHINDGTYA